MLLELPMPKKLHAHQTVPLDQDVVIIGGTTNYGNGMNMQSSLYRFTCQNQDCEFKTMSQELKISRGWFVAMLIPDDLVDCGKH